MILEPDNVTEVSLDHDLGEDEGVGTGATSSGSSRSGSRSTTPTSIIHVHTSNLGARDMMELGVLGDREPHRPEGGRLVTPATSDGARAVRDREGAPRVQAIGALIPRRDGWER